MDVYEERQEKEKNDGILTRREYYIYCRNLGVDPCSSWGEIREKSKALRLQFHTDKLLVNVERVGTESVRAKDFQTDEIFRVIEISFKKLAAHHKAVQKLRHQDLLSLVLVNTSEKNKTPNNKQQNQFLFAYLLVHATDEQLRFVSLDQRVCNAGLWSHTELISLFPPIVVVSLINEIPRLLDSLIADYRLIKTLLSKNAIFWGDANFRLRASNPSSLEDFALSVYVDLQNNGTVKKATVANFARAIKKDSLSPGDMLVSSSEVNCGRRFGASVREMDRWLSSHKKAYFKTFITLVIDQFETLNLTHEDDLILQVFYIAYNHLKIHLSDEFKQKLALIYWNKYDVSADDFDYLMFATFVHKVAAQFEVRDDAFYFMTNYNSLEMVIRAAKITFEQHGDDSLIRKNLPDARRLLSSKFDEMVALAWAHLLEKYKFNWYYLETLRFLSAINSPGLSEVEKNIGHIPTWEQIRDEILTVINRYVVINVECQQLLAKTRRALFKIDIEEDLSDFDKVLSLLQSFSELVSDINSHVGESMIRAAQMKKQLLPLIEEFYRFIESKFFMLSIQMEMFENLEFMSNPIIPIESFAKLERHDKIKFKSMIYLRFHHMATSYSRAYFKPDWDITVYEALDRLRILAHKLPDQGFGLLFKDAKKVAQASLINNLVSRVEYLPPEQIVEELQAVKKKDLYAEIPGFNDTVDGIETDIKGNVLLLTYTEDDLLKLTPSAQAVSEDEKPQEAEMDSTQMSPSPSRNFADVD